MMSRGPYVYQRHELKVRSSTIGQNIAILRSYATKCTKLIVDKRER